MSFQEIMSEIDATNHDKFLKNDLSILHFFSDWEMDCLMCLPIIESIAEEFSGKALFGKVNIEEAEDIAKKHKVLKVPSVLFFKNGSLVDRMDKMNSEDVLRHKINCLL
jgi:thioredoxin 1